MIPSHFGGSLKTRCWKATTTVGSAAKSAVFRQGAPASRSRLAATHPGPLRCRQDAGAPRCAGEAAWHDRGDDDDILHGDDSLFNRARGGYDLLDGGAGDTFLSGGPGSDRMDGGAGVDTAAFDGLLTDFEIATLGNRILVTDIASGDTDVMWAR